MTKLVLFQECMNISLLGNLICDLPCLGMKGENGHAVISMDAENIFDI